MIETEIARLFWGLGFALFLLSILERTKSYRKRGKVMFWGIIAVWAVAGEVLVFLMR